MSRRPSVIDLTSAPRPSSPRLLVRRRLSSDVASIETMSASPEEQSTPGPSDHITSRGAKRRRDDDEDNENGIAGPSSRPRIEESIQAIDLTEVDSSSELAKTLSNIREDAVRAQRPSENEGNKNQSILGAYKCPVCMDTPEDATSTACGHLFCHRCILECLATADARSSDSNKNKGTCPVCRKSITKNETPGPRRSLIPLQLKLTTKKRSVVPPTEG